jgi:3-methyladenine DNA glycosylase AlkD
MIDQLHADVQNLADAVKAKFLAGFFKTGKGQYGENDVFLGITVPQSRKIAVKYKELPLTQVKELLASQYHEERLIALLILVHNFGTADEQLRKEIVDFYLAHTKYINNWDLVDLSADKIVGEYLFEVSKVSKIPKVSKAILRGLARSEDLWERRIAMVATYAFIKRGESEDAFAIADILLHDTHDLIQKAVGWMLREVGKRVSEDVEEAFLRTRYKTMPRTALRYAIERFAEEKRKQYLRGEV